MTVALAPASSLEDRIEHVLRRMPGSSAREIVSALNAGQVASHLTKRDVNPTLYRSGRFRSDGGYVPRWTVSGVAPTGRQIERQAVTTAVRNARDVLDDLQPLLAPVVTTRSAPPNRDRIDWGNSWRIATLHLWQREALEAWFDAGGRGVVTAVTGTGKTHLGLEAMLRMHDRGGRSVVLVPTVELQRQWRRRIREHAPELVVAEIGGEAMGPADRADVVVALVQSARKRDLALALSADLLIADEAHRYGSVKWAEALSVHYEYRLGLTATLERSNDDGVDETLLPYFHREVFSYGYSRAVPEGVVAPFDLLFLGVELADDDREEYDDASEKITRAGARLASAGVFDAGPAVAHQRIARLAGAPGPLGRAAKSYESAVRRRRNLLANTSAKVDVFDEVTELIEMSQGTVVFTQTIDAANEAAWRLRENHITAAAVHSKLDPAERRAGLDSLEDRSVQAVCAPKILDEGIDIPNVDLGVVMSASRSRRQMIQRLGRVIRLKPDGRAARFVVLFAENTVEDPAGGSHEGFIQMVRDVARSETVLDAGWDVDGVLDALVT